MNLDDDLLALVEGTSTSKRNKKRDRGEQRPKKESDSDASDMDMSSDEEVPARKASPVKASRDGDDDTRSKYPLEGKYIDAQDRERIMNMTELERENILGERQEEISKELERKQLRAMVRNKKMAATDDISDTIVTGTRDRKMTGATDSKRETLEVLKRKREEKGKKKGKDEESEEEWTRRDDSDYPSDHERSRKQRSSEHDDVGPTDFKGIVVSRARLSRLCAAPWFKKWAIDAWVRYSVGMDNDMPIYRLCEIVDVVDHPELSYQFEGVNTTLYLVLKIGSVSKEQPMTGVSNSLPTEQEFIRLSKTLRSEGLDLPSVSEAKKLREKLDKHTDYILTEADISSQLAKKNVRGRHTKAKLIIQRDLAKSTGDEAALASINEELAQFDRPNQLLAGSRQDGEGEKTKLASREEMLRAEARVQLAKTVKAEKSNGFNVAPNQSQVPPINFPKSKTANIQSIIAKSITLDLDLDF